MLLLFFLSIANAASAQDLQAIWENTKQYYKGFDEKKQGILLAKQDSLARLLLYKPQVQIQFQQGLSTAEGGTGAFIPLAGIVNVNASDAIQGDKHLFNHYLSGIMTWDFLRFGKRDLDKQIGHAQVRQSVLEESLFELQLQEQLIARFMNLQYLEVMVTWYTQQLKHYRLMLSISRNLAEAGIKPAADSLIAKSALHQMESNLTLLQGRKEGAKFLLKEFIGQEVDWTNDQNGRKFMMVVNRVPQDSLIHPEINMELAALNRLALDQQRHEKEKLPRFLLLGGLSNRSSSMNSAGEIRTNYGQLYDRFSNNYFLGVGVTWNFQQFLKGASDKKYAQIKYQEKSYATELLKAKLEAVSADLEAQVLAAETSMNLARKSMQDAEKAQEMYRTRYEGGLINLTELLQVQDMLLQTSLKEVNAYRDYWKLLISWSYQRADFSLFFNHFNG